MRNKGFTLLELVIGCSIFVGILAMLSFYVRPVYHFFDKHTAFYQNIAQLNNIQHIISSDIQKASKIDVDSSGSLITLEVDGATYSYFFENGYLLRKKTNKMKLNSDKVLINDFRVVREGNLILVDYVVSLLKGETIHVKDTVYIHDI